MVLTCFEFKHDAKGEAASDHIHRIKRLLKRLLEDMESTFKWGCILREDVKMESWETITTSRRYVYVDDCDAWFILF